MKDPRQDLDLRRASFLSGAAEYERYRPGYPAAAIEWLVGSAPRRILDVGCGPGTLTRALAASGHHVVGADPSGDMTAAARAEGLPVVRARAEALPFATGCVDAVTAATAFHWFDHERAVPEMRRVLRPDGVVALLTNVRDESVPWVKALSDIIGSEAAMSVTVGGADSGPIQERFVTKLERRGLFHSTEHRVFDHAQILSEEQLLGLVASRSYIAVLPDDERERLLGEVSALCREHPDLLGREEFSMPYGTHAFRAFPG